MEVPAENCTTKEIVRSGAQDGSLLVVDVRNPDELQNGTIESKRWLNIPFTEFAEALKMSDEDFLQKYGQNKPKKDGSDLVTNCGYGNRSSRALAVALEMGYANARHLPGGYNGYAAWLSSKKSA